MRVVFVLKPGSPDGIECCTVHSESREIIQTESDLCLIFYMIRVGVWFVTRESEWSQVTACVSYPLWYPRALM